MIESSLTFKRRHGTSQISAIDASGMAISLTTTINLFFGSHVMDPKSGIILNNQMNGEPPHSRPTAPITNYTPTHRFLHPQHLQRLRLQTFPSKLHPPPQTPPLLHGPPHRLFAPFPFLLLSPSSFPVMSRHPRPRLRRRLPHHHRPHPANPLLPPPQPLCLRNRRQATIT